MAVENLRRSLSTDSERKYQLISKASIQLFADSKGYSVSDDVVRLLTEDVNYRLREIVSESSQYMKRSVHSYMRVSDVNHALSDANVSHIYPSTHTDYTYLPSHKIYTPSDGSVDLSSVITSELTPSPKSCFSHQCVSIQPTNAPSMDSVTRHVLSQYFAAITEAVAGNDIQLRKVALADVIHNTKIEHVQQQLILFIQKWVNASLKARRSMHHPLELLDAFTNNKSLNFSRSQVSSIADILVNSVCLGQAYGDVLSQLAQQQYASSILRKCLCDSASGQHIKTETLTRCKGIVQRSASNCSTTTLIGALAIIIALQPMALLDLRTAIDKLIKESSRRTDMQTSLVISLLIDGLNRMIKQAEGADKELSTAEINGILLYATSIQQHFPDQCVCRLPLSAGDKQLYESPHVKPPYLKRTLSGQANCSSISLSNCFELTKPVARRRSLDGVKLNYGVVKYNLKGKAPARQWSGLTHQTLSRGSQTLYNAWEKFRHLKVTKRSPQKVFTSQPMLFITL